MPCGKPQPSWSAIGTRSRSRSGCAVLCWERRRQVLSLPPTTAGAGSQQSDQRALGVGVTCEGALGPAQAGMLSELRHVAQVASGCRVPKRWRNAWSSSWRLNGLCSTAIRAGAGSCPASGTSSHPVTRRTGRSGRRCWHATATCGREGVGAHGHGIFLLDHGEPHDPCPVEGCAGELRFVHR